jgi:hypothetical protein
MTLLFKVSTLADPSTSDRELLVNRPGWALMRARPAETEKGQILWIDLLHALGHDLNFTRRERSTSRADVLAFCWLATGAVRDLIVAGANLLPPTSLRELCTLTSALGVRTWLLYDIETCDEREEAERSLAFTSVELEAFLEIRRGSGGVEVGEVREPFPLCPDIHFLGFLDSAETVLGSDDLAVVRQSYESAKTEMARRMTSASDFDEESLARLLHEVTVGTNDMNQITAMVKGAQVAAFICGWLIEVDIPSWSQRGLVAALEFHLDDEEWAQLGRLYKCYEAATCVLATLGISVEHLSSVLGEHVALDGTTVHYQGRVIQVPLPAQSLLVAQHIFREVARSESDLFLLHGPKETDVNEKFAGTLLKLATRDTGVILRSSNASRKTLDIKRWSYRLGIKVTRLSNED